MEDLGTYDYNPLHEITIDTLKNRTIEIYHQLEVEAKISFSGKETPLEYCWYRYTNNDLEVDTLSLEKKLVYNVNLSVGNYTIYLKVTDKETGLSSKSNFTLSVTGKFDKGLMVLGEVDGTPNLVFLNTAGNLVEVYGADNGHELGTHPVIVADASTTQIIKLKDMFILNGTSGGVTLNNADLTVSSTFEDLFYIAPQVINPQAYYKGVYPAGYGTMADFIINNGKMWDSILEVLHRKAMQGVDVRVLYDDFGCITRLPMRYCKKLREMGIEAHVFNPFIPVLSGRLNNRDHRKLMLIDGKVGFTGGVNLADEYINEIERFGHWKDCGILVKGEAVWSMVMMFLSIWDYVAGLEEDVAAFRPDYPEDAKGEGYLQPFADSPLDHEDVGATIFQSLIQSACRRLWIMTPYLILDDKMISALCVAAKTGVDVRIITPGIPDKWYVHAVTRANYEPLTEAGVRIFEFKPGFIHSKVCLADDQYAVVGTVNMDFRSLYLHFEDAVYLYDSPAVSQVAQDFEETFPVCREMTYARCRHVHFYQRILRALLQVFSPLL